MYSVNSSFINNIIKFYIGKNSSEVHLRNYLKHWFDQHTGDSLWPRTPISQSKSFLSITKFTPDLLNSWSFKVLKSLKLRHGSPYTIFIDFYSQFPKVLNSYTCWPIKHIINMHWAYQYLDNGDQQGAGMSMLIRCDI